MALILSYQNADARRSSDGTDINVIALARPLPAGAATGDVASPLGSGHSVPAAGATKPAITISKSPTLAFAVPGKETSPLSAAPAPRTRVTPVQDGLAAPESDNDFHTTAPQTSDVDTQPPMPVAAADWNDVTIKRGDSLSLIFDRQHLPASDWMQIAKLKNAAALKGMQPGDEIQLRKGDDGHLAELVYPINATRTLRITRDDGNFVATVEQAALEHRSAFAQGTITNSLYLAGDAAGLPDRLIMELTHIFAWNIDFSRDIRKGDHFTVIYDQVWHDGEKIRNGSILAAEFDNNGTTYRAFRYVDKDGNANYYTAAGKSLRKGILRAPLKYTRISSPFNRHRMHPILHIVRPHLGTDYAAPMGTPVEAAGDGRIEFAGRKHGYGNVILIRHNADYETVYAHLHKFAKGVHAGREVRQGQIIGYVGATGMATGPHLHFGVRVDGRFQNPRTVALPQASPVPKKYMATFHEHTQPLIAQLDQLDHDGPLLAHNP